MSRQYWGMWKNRLRRLKTGPGIAGFLLVIGPWLYRAIDVISNIDFLINLRSNENAKMAWSFVSSMSSHVGITILGIVWLTYLILRPEKKKTAHAQQGEITEHRIINGYIGYGHGRSEA